MLKPMLQEFSEQQKKIVEALRRLNLEKKLENYITIEKEKAERKELVTGYPYWLTIDPSNYCNLKCPFCPTGQGRGSRPKAILSFGNFKRIIEELGPYLIHIDFCNWGEPFLNKDLADMISIAKRYSIDTKIDTNLTVLSEEAAERIISSGLDKIIVSIDGASQETYSKYRIGGEFKNVLKNLGMLIEKKRRIKSFKPHITWQFLVFRHNEHEIEDVKKLGSRIGVDHVGITKAFIGDKDWMPLNENYSNYKKEEMGNDYTSEHFKKPLELMCNWPWEAITINSNGSVSACCSVEDEADDFGNIFQTSFSDIWNNENYRLARRHIRDRVVNSKGKNICIKCRHLGMINLDMAWCHSLF